MSDLRKYNEWVTTYGSAREVLVWSGEDHTGDGEECFALS